jgi:hypothetical protein
MDTLQRLVELEALKRLKASYFYHIDHKNWDEWLALFTPDASLAWDGTVSTLGREGKLAGRHVGHAAIRESDCPPDAPCGGYRAAWWTLA